MILFILLFLAAAARGMFLLTKFPLEDPAWSPHWNLATGLLKYGTLGYHGERVTNIEPGYSLFLAATRWIFQENLTLVFTSQIAVSVLSVFFLYALTLRMTGNVFTARLSAFFFAVYPYLIGQSVSIIEVTLVASQLIVCAYFWASANQTQTLNNAVLCGLVFGLTFLTRSMVLPCFVLCFLAFLFQKKIKVFLAASLVFLAVVSPWIVRSYSVDGTIIPPRGGWNFLQGNCPYSDKIIPDYNPDLLDAYVSQVLEKERPDLAEGPERETLGKDVDRFFSAKAFEFIKENPWRFLRLKILNVFYLYHPRIVPFYSMDRQTKIHFTGPETFEVEGVPQRGTAKESAHFIFYGFLLLTAAAGIWTRRKEWRKDLFFYFLALNFTLVYSLYWPATRLRAPMDFILMFFSACALAGSEKIKRLFRERL